jgi:SAM-dependent methyltransferase
VPAVRKALTVKSDRNPPVLHRVEEFVGANHPSRTKFARLTWTKEAKGPPTHPSYIGTRNGWCHALANKGLAFIGHRLVKAKSAESADSDWSRATRAFYEQRASEYAASTLNAPMEPILSAFAARMPVDAKVIDLGCGAGRDLALFRARGLNPVGLDYSIALALLAHRHSGAPVVVGDIRRLPVVSGVFHGAWAAASLLHLRRAENLAALAEVRRVLRPKGLLFTSMKRGSGEEQDQHGRWFSYFEPEEWTSCLEEAGFDVLDAKSEHEFRRTNLSAEDISWFNCTARRK